MSEDKYLPDGWDYNGVRQGINSRLFEYQSNDFVVVAENPISTAGRTGRSDLISLTTHGLEPKVGFSTDGQFPVFKAILMTYFARTIYEDTVSEELSESNPYHKHGSN